jgi:ABC-type uncharacterized transport system ATPase subunit
LGSTVEFQQLNETRCQVIFDRREMASAELLKRIVNYLPVRDIALEDTTIEEVVREIYNRGGLE